MVICSWLGWALVLFMRCHDNDETTINQRSQQKFSGAFPPTTYISQQRKPTNLFCKSYMEEINSYWILLFNYMQGTPIGNMGPRSVVLAPKMHIDTWGVLCGFYHGIQTSYASKLFGFRINSWHLVSTMAIGFVWSRLSILKFLKKKTHFCNKLLQPEIFYR